MLNAVLYTGNRAADKTDVISALESQSGIQKCLKSLGASQMELVVKSPPAKAGNERDLASVPGSGRSPGGGHSNPLHYSCLENPMDRGAWEAIGHGVAQSQTQLK